MIVVEEGSLSAPITDLEIHGLSQRHINDLEDRFHYTCIGDLQQLTESGIAKTEGIADAFRWELEHALRSYCQAASDAEECQKVVEDKKMVNGHRREADIHLRFRDIVGSLRQTGERHCRAAASAMVELLEENARLWAEVRRLRGDE